MSPSNQTPDDGAVPDQDKYIGHPGRLLASVRKERNIDVAAVAADLGMTPGAIRDLENEQFQRFSADIYLRGYLRNYARLLGVNDQRIQSALDRFQERAQEGQPPVRRTERKPPPARTGNPAQQARIRRWTIILFAFGFLAFGGLVAVVIFGRLMGTGG